MAVSVMMVFPRPQSRNKAHCGFSSRKSTQNFWYGCRSFSPGKMNLLPAPDNVPATDRLITYRITEQIPYAEANFGVRIPNFAGS